MPMREIKLSLKDAREREERNRGENKAGWWEYCHHTQDNFGAIYGVHPPHKPSWHRAPDPAMLKSRPVDPPRERDYAKLTEAAKRKEAPFVDWNGLSSDPCLKYAGIGGGGHASPPASGSGNLPDAAPAPAPVADSAVGEFEPEGTPIVVGDKFVNVLETATDEWRTPSLCARIDENGVIYDENGKNLICTFGFDANRAVLGWRILKRKNVAARAWRSDKCSPSYPKELRWAFLELGGQNFLRLWGGGWVRAEKPRGGYGDGATEIHDPAEIQRLVAELHAAGLGK